jgi:hypothetical protein
MVFLVRVLTKICIAEAEAVRPRVKRVISRMKRHRFIGALWLLFGPKQEGRGVRPGQSSLPCAA